MRKGQIDETELRLRWRQLRDDSADSASRGALVTHYLPLVYRIAGTVMRAVHYRAELGDLISSGVIGLHKAISKYADDAVTFEAFAYKYVRCAMYEELRSLDPLTRSQRRAFRLICQVSRLLADTTGSPPTHQQVAAQLGLTSDEVAVCIGIGLDTVDIHARNDDGTTLLDRLACQEPAPDATTDRKLALELLFDAILHLDEDEQNVIRSRAAERPVHEIAGEMSVTPGRVSQVYSEAIGKLRKIVNPPRKKRR